MAKTKVYRLGEYIGTVEGIGNGNFNEDFTFYIPTWDEYVSLHKDKITFTIEIGEQGKLK